MNISFYAPLKPLGHAHPSGDLVTATGLFEFLSHQGHQVTSASSFRCRWLYWKPWLWPTLLWERQKVIQRLSSKTVDLWFTYHSYYKAPDLLGPVVSRKINTPYVIFQGIYSTKRKRRLKTMPGFYLNKNTLSTADHVFTNKTVDQINLQRLLPLNRITYVAPGIMPGEFTFDGSARDDMRRHWQVGDEPVIFSAAMFRPDVKTEGLRWGIRACGELFRQGNQFWLVIAGDGKEKKKLQKMAAEQMPGRVRFVGKIPRRDMYRYYSAADLFVFPGIRESLGMVFLEAQSCGLPVVAFDNAGVPEAVQHSKTGLLVPMFDLDSFVRAIERLLNNGDLRRRMGDKAKTYIRETHNLTKNYEKLEKVLHTLVERRPKR